MFEAGMRVRLTRTWTKKAKRQDPGLRDGDRVGTVVRWTDLGEDGSYLELREDNGRAMGWAAPHSDAYAVTELEPLAD